MVAPHRSGTKEQEALNSTEVHLGMTTGLEVVVETVRQERQVCEPPPPELSYLKRIFFPFYFLCTDVSPACMFVHTMHAVPSEAREGHRIPWN